MVVRALGLKIGPRLGWGDYRARRSLAVGLASLLLSACAFDPPTIERTPREAAGAESSAKSRLATRKGGATNGAAQQATPGAAPGAPGTEMAALEVDLTNFKERLIGLDSDEINDLMGTPGLERAEPPALIWQYRHQVCTVDIFMFDDGGGATVDHVEVRPTTGSNVNEKECFTALLRNMPAGGGAQSAAKSPASQPIAPSPSSPVNRRPVPSAAPASGPAQTPSSSRPPVPSSAAPSSAPTAPRPAAPAAAAGDDDGGPPPEDTDVDFDMGVPPSNAAGAAPPPAARPPSAAPSSEAIPEIPGDTPTPLSGPPPGPSGALAPSASPSTNLPSAALPPDDDDDFADPLSPPTQTAKPTPPAQTSPTPSAPTASAAPTPSPAPAEPVARPALPQSGPAQLTPPPPAPTASAAPKGRAPVPARTAANRPVEDIDDEDLPPDLLHGRRADDDPANTNDDMVE